MLTNIVYEQIAKIIIVVCETFNNIEMIHSVFNLEIHVLHQTCIVEEFEEISRLLLEGRTIVLTCYDIKPYSSNLQVRVVIELRRERDSPFVRKLHLIVDLGMDKFS